MRNRGKFLQNSLFLSKFWIMHCKIGFCCSNQVKSLKRPYFGKKAKTDKNKGTLFSPTLKIDEKKVCTVVQIWAYWPRYDQFIILRTLREILKIINPFVKKLKHSVVDLFGSANSFLWFLGPLVTLKNYWGGK